MEMQKTRTLAGIVALTATGVLVAGCAGAGGGDAGGAEDLSVAIVAAPGLNDCLADAADKYEEETGSKITVTELPYAAMYDKYLAGFAAGNAPFDLMGIPYQWTGQFASQGAISEVTLPEGLAEGVDAPYQWDGKQYAVPYVSGVMGYFYRTDILEELGYDSFPTTNDEILALIDDAANNADLQQRGISGTSVMADPSQIFSGFVTLYGGFGGSLLQNEDGSVAPIDVAAATKTLEALQELIELSPAGALTATHATVPAQFMDGTVALLPMYVSSLSGAALKGSSVADDYGFAPAPGGGDVQGWGLAIDAKSKKQEAAQAFADYLNSSEVEMHCVLEYGRPPVLASSFENADAIAATPALPGMQEALAGGGIPRWNGPNGQAQYKSASTIISEFLAGQIASAEEAAERMASESEKIANG